MTVTATDLIPDLLAIALPLLAGVLLLVQEFSWAVLVAVAALLIPGFFGTAFVRGQLACPSCRQRELGYPPGSWLHRAGQSEGAGGNARGFLGRQIHFFRRK